jgi:pyruvate,water dikinase
MDILYPTWCEDPEPVYSFIRSYLDADQGQSPYRQQQRLSQEREQLTGKVMKDLEKGLVGRLVVAPVFRWILNQTQIHTRERDTMHFEMTRLFPPLREMLLDLGSRWVVKGLLDRQEDILFLQLAEIEAVAQEPSRMQDTVRSRRQIFAHNKQRAWPDIICNGEESYAQEAVLSASEATSLQGVAGSPGKVEGQARVILGPEQFGNLKKGEILVAPITNPVWTPLFAIAGGVITEVGGILSHGAIVAREYGIPAVMSVSGATRYFQDGQTILVDGNKGVVYLEMET